MLIRLQGFANDLFGGHFYTDNGIDYARGMRYNVEQVKNARIVMSVDCTDINTKWNQASFNLKLKYLIKSMLFNNEYTTINNSNICNHTTGSMNSINGKRLWCSSNINNNNNGNDNGSKYTRSIKPVRSCFKYGSGSGDTNRNVNVNENRNETINTNTKATV